MAGRGIATHVDPTPLTATTTDGPYDPPDPAGEELEEETRIDMEPDHRIMPDGYSTPKLSTKHSVSH